MILVKIQNSTSMEEARKTGSEKNQFESSFTENMIKSKKKREGSSFTFNAAYSSTYGRNPAAALKELAMSSLA